MDQPFCYYSFEPLNPQNPDPSLRTFVSCVNCGYTYHEKYWNLQKQCLNCQCSEVHLLGNIPVPEPPQPLVRTPIHITPVQKIWAGTWYQHPVYQTLVGMTLLLIVCACIVSILILRFRALEERKWASATATMQTAMEIQWAQTETARPTNTPTLTMTPSPTATITSTPTPTPQIGSTQVSPIDGMVMVYVPQGYFIMGSDNGKPGEKPSHQVWLNAYWIDKTEVTNAMYALCVQSGRCSPPRNTTSPGRINYFGNPQYDDYPVINTSWDDATSYCNWAGRRLLTEAEWEKAARGTDERIYPWGNEFIPANLNSGHRLGVTTKVGSFPAGVSPYGALDLSGNVWEWVGDWYDSSYYEQSPQRNPPGPTSGNGRVVRGGGWGSTQYDVRVFHRSNQSSQSTGPGFRCAQ